MRGRVILGLVLWVAVLRGPSLFVDPFGWDEGFYLIVGRRLLSGAQLYVDLWDYKPPGIFLIYAALVAVSGGSVAAIVAGSALAVLATALLLALIGERVFGQPRAGLYAAVMFPTYMLVREGSGANAENFFVIFGALSVLLLGTHLRTPAEMPAHRRVAFVFGLIQGVALQIKLLTAGETALLGLIFAAVVWSERRRLLDAIQLFASFIAAFTLPTLIAFGYFWHIGALDQMVFANFISPAFYAKSPFGLNELLKSLKQIVRLASVYAPLILAGGLFVIFSAASVLRSGVRGSVPLCVTMAWLLGAIFSSTYTGYFFDHYFIVLAAPLSLLAALGVDRFSRGRNLEVRDAPR